MKFEKVRGNLGLGCMRLPMVDGEIDKEKFCQMADAFIAGGFNYFDTAHGYIDGKSEPAIGECISARHNREDFVLADKLTYWLFEKEEDVLPLFEKQLKQCGVEYFDFYLFHALNRKGYQKHKDCNTFKTVQNLKEQGKIKHIGMSFHDSAEILDMILTEQPFIEFVQLQINYLDYDDPTVQSKACYDVAVKHGKKVIVMEPVRGGALVNLPDEAACALKEAGEGSQASFALRYAASFPEVFMVLSGMGSMDMLNENMATFSHFEPLDENEIRATDKAREIIRKLKQLPCTKCDYCAEVCPENVPVSRIFTVYNNYLGAKISRGETKRNLAEYKDGLAACIKCGKCQQNCPQSIAIPDELEKINQMISD